MCGSMADIQSAAAEIRRGKNKKKKEKQITARKYNGLPYSINTKEREWERNVNTASHIPRLANAALDETHRRDDW